MKFFMNELLLAEDEIDQLGSLLKALETGALNSFTGATDVLILAEPFEIEALKSTLHDLMLSLEPWTEDHPYVFEHNRSNAFQIKCHGGYEPLLQGYCIEFGFITATSTYSLSEQGERNYHMQASFSPLDTCYHAHNQLFNTIDEAKGYILHGEYKDYDLVEVNQLPFVCHKEGSYNTLVVDDSCEQATYHTYNFTYWIYTHDYGWQQGTPPQP